MSQRPQKPAPVVVKRPPEQRRKLSPDLEAFARSDDEKLRIRRPRVDRGLIRDPREGYTVAGVANRDARSVYDVRSVAMRALWDEGAADDAALATLGQLFHDALRLELWHARRLTSFAAFAEEVVGVPAERAEALADEAAQRTGEPVTPLTEVAIALWLRTEAGLYEGDEGGRARVRSGERGLVLELTVDLVEASTALAGVGARHLPLARSVPAREESRPSHDDRRGYDDRGGRPARPEPSERARPERPERQVASDYRRGADYERDVASEELPSRSELPAASELADELESLEDGEVLADGEALEESESLADSAALDDSEALDEGESLSDDSLDAEAPKSAVGGARLLTRKPQLPRAELADDDGDETDGSDDSVAAPAGKAPWGRRESRTDERSGEGAQAARPAPRNFDAPRGGAPRDDRGGERPKFGGDRGGERPKFGADRGGERPKFGADRGGERPKFGADRGGERPKFGADRGGERPKFGADRGGERKFGGATERPRFGGGNERGGERPRAPGGFTQGGDSARPGARFERGGSAGAERPRFGNNERSGGGDRPRFGNNERGDKPAGGFTIGNNERSGGERPRFGNNERSAGGERPRFGSNERSAGGERTRFGSNERSGNDRPRFGGGGERGDKRPGGFVSAAGKPAPGAAGKFGDDKRAPGKGFGARQSFSGNAPTGRDRDPTRASPRRDDDSEA